jgi:hypothetical protein
MPIWVHDDLPGQVIDMPEAAGEILAVSGWHRPQRPTAPEPEDLSATHPEGEADTAPAKKK